MKLSKENESFYYGKFERAIKIYDLTDEYGAIDENKVKVAKKELLEKLGKSYDVITECMNKYLSEKDSSMKENAFLIENYLKNPELLNIINEEFEKKIVGEIEARLTIFMVANMRNVENLNKTTDNLMINADSGTGKDHISEAVFEMIPEGEKEELIRTTPKVLAYARNRIKPKREKDER